MQLTHDRQAQLAAAEEKQRHLDDLYLEYAKQAPVGSMKDWRWGVTWVDMGLISG